MTAIRVILAAMLLAAAGFAPSVSATSKSSPKLALCQVGGWFGGIRVTTF